MSRVSRTKLKEIKKEFITLMAKPENKENRMRFFVIDERFHKLLNEKCKN
ncbi:unnamed protein product [marine sediment metagenome]|uniref:Uncharacterized protein n=1 Tax=marine sediment metagenome TaxID=412755 RepID=X1E4E2_9ZZZZ